jgi:hypothetical protein
VGLWDPLTGEAGGEPLVGHTGWVNACCALPLPGQTLLVWGLTEQTAAPVPLPNMAATARSGR